jgi:hypothetical protein
MSVFVRFRHVFSALIAAGVVAAVGCEGGAEGDRCNPLLSHNDCNGGLTCMQPGTCAESYCCPTPASASSNPFCNGSSCPPAEAGAGEAGPGDASPDASTAHDADGDGPSAAEAGAPETGGGDASGGDASKASDAADSSAVADASDSSSAADVAVDTGSGADARGDAPTAD